MPELDPQQQRQFALQVVAQLREQGHTALWAGGCVRDMLLGVAPKDYDVATDARPEQVRDVFGRHKTIAIGASFGVITVLGDTPRAGQIEVATFRSDEAYVDGRRPTAVRYSTPQEDAERRDLTINGVFYDPASEEFLDYVGGRADLAARIVRAIGDPRARFEEDKLRMLRAVRFATTLDFELDDATFAAIRERPEAILVVSAERIAQEMRRLLADPHRRRGVELLDRTGLLAVLLPEAAAMHGVPQTKRRQPDGDLWDHAMLVMEELGRGQRVSFELALAALLHDVGKPMTLQRDGEKLSFYDHELVGARIAGYVCRRWKLSRQESQRIIWLVRRHMYLGEARRMRWAKLQRALTEPGIEELLDLHEADARASGGELDDVEYCRQLLRQPPEELDPAQLLTGHDLIRHGVPQGRIYQWLLDQVRDAQLERQIRTKRDALALVDRLLAEGVPAEEEGGDEPK